MSRRNSFTRSKASKRPYRRFLIVCEGEKSEPDYIVGVKPLCRAQLIEIQVVGGAGATKKVVEEAVALKKAAIAKAKKASNGFEQFDEVWCVLDVDDHLKLREALKQAKDNEIKIALSNPCYELWVIMHHRDERKSVQRSKLQSECCAYYKTSTKHVPFSQLWPHYEIAKTRAQLLRVWQKDMGRPFGDPWTDFDCLIDALLQQKKP
jgi:RloB-like protein